MFEVEESSLSSGNANTSVCLQYVTLALKSLSIKLKVELQMLLKLIAVVKDPLGLFQNQIKKIYQVAYVFLTYFALLFIIWSINSVFGGFEAMMGLGCSPKCFWTLLMYIDIFCFAF